MNQFYVEVTTPYFAERAVVNSRKEADEWVTKLKHQMVFRHGLTFDENQWKVRVRAISG